MYRSEEGQMLLLIRSPSLHPCFKTVEAEFPQRTWLIRRSTNTANYSLMPLSESQFSQRPLPMPQKTDAHHSTHHRRLNKDKWGLSKMLPINKSLSFALSLQAHITLALISAALRMLIAMTWHWSGLWYSIWVKPSRHIIDVYFHVSLAPGVVMCDQTQQGKVSRSC